MSKKKILNSLELKNCIASKRNLGKKIVLCHGVFDILHIGHIKNFFNAKKNGDFLVVSITSDKFVNKGSGRPIFNHDLRAEFLSFLSIVDAVYINHNPTAVNVIEIIKPDVYFKGPDYKSSKLDRTGNILKEIKAVKKFNGKFKYSDDIVFSSSNLINNYHNIFDPKQKQYLKNISNKYSYDFISKQIDRLKKLKVLLIGEVIIDQYIFGEVLGKSGKEPHLVMNINDKKNYLGGAGAIAGHLSTFCESINFISMIGDDKEYSTLIKKSLDKKVKTSFFIKKNSRTILKTRFVDSVSKNKLLGVYNVNEEKILKNTELKIQKRIKFLSKKSDLIVISDYGHGLISKETANKIVSINKFISLNAQVNASNYGYHSLRKYRKINSLVINENELRHELRDKKSSLPMLADKLINNFNIKTLIITRGKEGSLMIKKNKKKATYCPAFAVNIVDKVGAGDAMLAIVSLCQKIGMPDDLTLLVGSFASAISVESIANSQFADKNKILRKIEYSIK
jgi:rfaE bifunctional protein kinase chain/domain/rfaE bifunctional protein nucleotidyltransferase chain/domain